MNLKQILFLIFISSLLLGSAYAASISDFNVDEKYHNGYTDEYHTLYVSKDMNSGIAIFKNADDDAYPDSDVDEAYDDLIHDDGQEYLTPDDEMDIDKQADHTAEFTDKDHAQHGIVELVKKDNDEFIVVFWAKDSSDIKNSDLTSAMKDFNKDNDIESVAF